MCQQQGTPMSERPPAVGCSQRGKHTYPPEIDLDLPDLLREDDEPGACQ